MIESSYLTKLVNIYRQVRNGAFDVSNDIC